MGQGATSLTVTFNGFKELNDELAAMEVRVAKRLMHTAMHHAMVPVLETAKELCPVSEDGSRGNPPGYLRDSLILKSLPQGQDHNIKVGLTTKKGAFESGKYYGGYVEYGTHKMAARPFLRPALDQNKEKVLTALGDEIAKAIAGQHAKEAGEAVGHSEQG